MKTEEDKNPPNEIHSSSHSIPVDSNSSSTSSSSSPSQTQLTSSFKIPTKRNYQKRSRNPNKSTNELNVAYTSDPYLSGRQTSFSSIDSSSPLSSFSNIQQPLPMLHLNSFPPMYGNLPKKSSGIQKMNSPFPLNVPIFNNINLPNWMDHQTSNYNYNNNYNNNFDSYNSQINYFKPSIENGQNYHSSKLPVGNTFLPSLNTFVFQTSTESKSNQNVLNSSLDSIEKLKTEINQSSSLLPETKFSEIQLKIKEINNLSVSLLKNDRTSISKLSEEILVLRKIIRDYYQELEDLEKKLLEHQN